MSKYYLYCQNEMSENPKEIYIRVPRLRLIYNMANQKYSMIKIPIYPNWETTEKFIEFIKNMEEEIFNTLNKKNEMSSLISKKNGLLLLKTKLQDNVKITSNLNKDVTLNDFKINGMIELVIRISYVWMKENKMGLSSQIYQIKYFAPPEQLDINFIDEHVVSHIVKTPSFQGPEAVAPGPGVRQTTPQPNFPGQPQQTNMAPGLTLPQVIALVDKRLNNLEVFAQKQSNSQSSDSESLNTNQLKPVFDEYSTRFDIIAEELASLKDTILKLQTYTMEVNKTLMEDRIRILSEEPTPLEKALNAVDPR
jgi:hypothetical protein